MLESQLNRRRPGRRHTIRVRPIAVAVVGGRGLSRRERGRRRRGRPTVRVGDPEGEHGALALDRRDAAAGEGNGRVLRGGG